MKRVFAFVMATVLGVSSLPDTALGYATDRATVKRQIRVAWLGNDKRAIRVADCESGLNPKALSPSGTYRGLWQFSLATWNDYDPPADDPIKVNAKKQTEVAWRLFQDRGWAPWPTCGAGKAPATGSPAWGPEATDVRRRSSREADTR